MTIQLYAPDTGLLTASDADLTIEYNLLTFGEEGFTSVGRVTVEPGSLSVPAGTLPVNDEHTPHKPVGYMTASESPERITAKVHFHHTDEGCKAYADAKEGKRKGISMEVLKPVIKAGKLLAGALCGSGIVARPAFKSSLLLAADYSEAEDGNIPAEDAAEADENLDAARAAIDAGDLDAAAAAIAAAQHLIDPDTENPDEEEEESMPNPLTAAAANPAALLASLLDGTAGAPGQQDDDALTLPKFTAAFREGIDMGDPKLKASHFDTITQTDLYDPAVQPAFLGELWRTNPYEEIWANLVAHEGLTAMSYEGYRWVEGADPIVDDWDPAFTDGDPDAEDPEDRKSHMNPIPTSHVRLESKKFHAKRLAGGNRFDRIYLDFNVPGVLESFLNLQTEGIKRRRDARVRAAVRAQAAANRITGATAGDLSSTFRRIILGAMHVMEYGKPTFAAVGNDVYREMLGTDMLENLALLEKSLGLEGGSMAGFRIQPARITDAEMNGKVLVGVDKSIVLHEPAGAPIRVDAQELAVGAVDKAVFSYYMLRSDDRGGVVEVPNA